MNFARTLYIWAKKKDNGLCILEDWLDEAITAIAEGKGSQIVSTTANGLSVSMSQNMNYMQWANILGEAIQYLERGKITSSTAIGRIV